MFIAVSGGIIHVNMHVDELDQYFSTNFQFPISSKNSCLNFQDKIIQKAVTKQLTANWLGHSIIHFMLEENGEIFLLYFYQDPQIRMG